MKEDKIEMGDGVYVGAQPSHEDLEALADEGFLAVANLRTEDEEDQPLSPDAERKKVEERGMSYLHFPVEASEVTEKRVDRFRERLARLPRPVYVHCNSGKRAGAFVVMDRAIDEGRSGEDAVRSAEGKGFECDDPELLQFVSGYIDARAG